MDLNDLARSNRRQILRTILYSGGISRSDLARRTGLAKSTVTLITDKLASRNLVYHSDSVRRQGRGRPQEILSLNEARSLVLVTTCYSDCATTYLLRPNGKVVDERRRRMKPRSPAPRYVQAHVRAIEEMGKGRWKRIQVIVVTGPGIVDSRKGVVRIYVRAGWRDAQLLEPFRRFGRPLLFQNGNRFRAVAEYWNGAAKDVNDFLFVHLGYGIGGAIVIGGELLEGPLHGAGEFGHISVDPRGSPCACGARGCLETVASSAALVAACRRLGPRSFSEVWDEFRRGNPAVGRIVRPALRMIARVVTNQVTAIGPPVVVMGGSMVEESEGGIVDAVADMVSRDASLVTSELQIRRAALTDIEALRIGAAYFALQEVDL